MITVNMSGEYGITNETVNSHRDCVVYGKSTDEKPVGGIILNGSKFIEMDTGKIYFYPSRSRLIPHTRKASGSIWSRSIRAESLTMRPA